MNIYTFYTESHERLLNDWFVPSFQKTNADLNLEIKKFDQKCISGNFMDVGWNESMKDKVKYILYSIEKTPENEFFVHADCDIQFFGNFSEYLNSIKNYCSYDILAQNDGNHTMCCGFMMIKSNSKTKILFEKILQLVTDNVYQNDQIALNMIFKNFQINRFLFDHKIYSIWRNFSGVWEKQDIPNVPNNLILHHANYTVGTENKINLMKLIKEKVTLK